MTIRGPLSDQEENQFSSLRIGAACILVNTPNFSQFSLEALAGVRVELPGRHTCSWLGSLTGASIPGGENIEVAESPRRPSWRKRNAANVDRVPVG